MSLWLVPEMVVVAVPLTAVPLIAVTRAVTVPFDGFIHQAPFRAGDLVEEGAPPSFGDGYPREWVTTLDLLAGHPELLREQRRERPEVILTTRCFPRFACPR